MVQMKLGWVMKEKGSEPLGGLGSGRGTPQLLSLHWLCLQSISEIGVAD